MRKLKILRIATQGIVDMLKGDVIKMHAKVIKDPIPTDAKVVRMVHDPRKGLMYIELQSDFFPEVPEDGEIPYLETQYQQL